MRAKLLQTLCDPVDCQPSGSSLSIRLLQAGTLEWVAFPSQGTFLTQHLLHCLERVLTH